MELLFIILLAVLVDITFGEPWAKIHPVVYMGRTIQFFKDLLSKYNNKQSGVLLTALVLIIFLSIYGVILEASKFNYFIYILVSALFLSTTFAIKSLITSVMNVKKNLDIELNKARNSISYLVSRNTTNLGESDIISAAIETLTENLTDSVTAPIFYVFIFGVLGGVFYRVVNTLDAMVGYKDPENINIGWFPAKLDDILNYIPARITGFLVVIAALFLRLDWKNSYKIMMRDARKTPSPNSGFPMAAAAGALKIQLKKQGYYQIGDNITPLTSETITEAVLLSKFTIIIFILLLTLIYSVIISFVIFS